MNSYVIHLHRHYIEAKVKGFDGLATAIADMIRCELSRR
jgi:hypothetical protein